VDDRRSYRGRAREPPGEKPVAVPLMPTERAGRVLGALPIGAASSASSAAPHLRRGERPRCRRPRGLRRLAGQPPDEQAPMPPEGPALRPRPQSPSPPSRRAPTRPGSSTCWRGVRVPPPREPSSLCGADLPTVRRSPSKCAACRHTRSDKVACSSSGLSQDACRREPRRSRPGAQVPRVPCPKRVGRMEPHGCPRAAGACPTPAVRALGEQGQIRPLDKERAHTLICVFPRRAVSSSNITSSSRAIP
jgi:hypothetical protein